MIILRLCFSGWTFGQKRENTMTSLSKNLKTLTASLNGSWVPQTSRSFHYRQPAPRWDCFHSWQILATQPWAPTQKGRRVPITIIIIIYTVETREHSRGKEQTRNYAQKQSGTTTNTRDTRACGQRKTAECTGLPTLAQSNKY